MSVKIQWYRVRIIARRIDRRVRVEEMVCDIEAKSPRDAIELARQTHRDSINRLYYHLGRTYSAVPMGTTAQLTHEES